MFWLSLKMLVLTSSIVELCGVLFLFSLLFFLLDIRQSLLLCIRGYYMFVLTLLCIVLANSLFHHAVLKVDPLLAQGLVWIRELC